MTDAKQETGADILAEMRTFVDNRMEEGRKYRITSECVWLIFHQFADRLEAAHKREHRWMMTAARWILCHDIHGHMGRELIEEAKEILNDDGQFLFKEGA